MPLVRTVSKNLKIVSLYLLVLTVSPIILMKLGLWETVFASEAVHIPMSAEVPRQGEVVSYASAVKVAAPAVVSIHTATEMPVSEHPLLRDPFFRHFFGNSAIPDEATKEVQPGLGSGVIVHQAGYILTNAHVIQGATEITVTLADERTDTATVVGIDTDSDLAVLRINLPNLPVVTLADSDNLEVGDVVLAIGNPYGVGQTVTQGIVSATKRKNMGISTFENFIQTDAAINPGNSGGALVNTYGHLVGINTAILSTVGANQGIGFATPSRLAQSIMSQLIDSGHVTRGWLGVSVRALTPELRDYLNYSEGEGAVVAGVLRNGPAQQAGIQPGDIIVSINSQPTNTPADILQTTSSLEPEKSYPIEVIRDNQTYDFQVIVGERPKNSN